MSVGPLKGRPCLLGADLFMLAGAAASLGRQTSSAACKISGPTAFKGRPAVRALSRVVWKFGQFPVGRLCAVTRRVSADRLLWVRPWGLLESQLLGACTVEVGLRHRHRCEMCEGVQHDERRVAGAGLEEGSGSRAWGGGAGVFLVVWWRPAVGMRECV